VAKLIDEARIYKPALHSVFAVNRKIVNTALGRDVRDALAAYSLPALDASVCQRIVFAESAAQGLAAFEVEPDGPAAREIEGLREEIMQKYGNP
jgi:chromosome partitioning protein